MSICIENKSSCSIEIRLKNPSSSSNLDQKHVIPPGEKLEVYKGFFYTNPPNIQINFIYQDKVILSEEFEPNYLNWITLHAGTDGFNEIDDVGVSSNVYNAPDPSTGAPISHIDKKYKKHWNRKVTDVVDEILLKKPKEKTKEEIINEINQKAEEELQKLKIRSEIEQEARQKKQDNIDRINEITLEKLRQEHEIKKESLEKQIKINNEQWEKEKIAMRKDSRPLPDISVRNKSSIFFSRCLDVSETEIKDKIAVTKHDKAKDKIEQAWKKEQLANSDDNQELQEQANNLFKEAMKDLERACELQPQNKEYGRLKNLVAIKIEGNRQFSAGINFELEAENFIKQAQAAEKKKDYQFALEKYNKALDAYKKAAENFKKGAETDSRFTVFLEYISKEVIPSVNTSIDNITNLLVVDFDAYEARIEVAAYTEPQNNPALIKHKGDVTKIQSRETTLEYWLDYNEIAINDLLELRLKFAISDIEMLNSIKIMGTKTINFSEGDVPLLQKQLIALALEVYSIYSSDINVKDILIPILIPVGEGVCHWAGIGFKKHNSRIEISYLDSEKPLDIEVYLQYFINQLQRLHSNYQVFYAHTEVELQKYNNCGPELIENFLYYLTGNRVPQEEAVYMHSILLESMLSDKPLNCDIERPLLFSGNNITKSQTKSINLIDEQGLVDKFTKKLSI